MFINQSRSARTPHYYYGFLLISLAGVIALFAGCGAQDEEQLIQAKIFPDSSFILPGTAQSCASRKSPFPSSDVVGPRLSYQSMEIKWNDSERFLSLAVIQLEFEAQELGGKYTCTLSQDELVALFGSAINQPLPPGATLTSDPICRISSCSGVTVATPDARFSLTGRIRIIGYSADEDGERQRPESGEGVVRLENIPF